MNFFDGGDADAGWGDVGGNAFGDDDAAATIKFHNSGTLNLDDYEDSGSDEEDYVVKFSEGGKQKKSCCRRCCRCFWCWKVPIISLPLSPLLFWNLAFLGVFVPLFVLNIDEPKLAGVYLRWWALAFAIMCVAAVLSRLAVGLIYFIGEIVVARSDRIFYYINDLEWPFALLGWGGGMLITLNVWLKDLEPAVFKAFHIIFIMTIVAAVGRVVQIVLVKLISSMMNKKKFWTNVADSLFRQRVILKLLAGKRKYRGAQLPNQAAHQQSATSDAIGGSMGVSRQATARTLAARERLTKLVSFKRIRQLYDNHQTQQTILDVLRPKDERQMMRDKGAVIKTAKLGTEASKITIEAKIDGNRVFEILDIDRKGYIVPEDLVGFFKDSAKEQRAFKILQPPPHTKPKLGRKDIVKAVNSVYKDREKLVRNMKDRQSVAGVLSKTIAVILFLVAVIIFITLLGVDFVSFIAPFGTAVLAISFVFGTAAASAFKSFVFLLFVNPYDVGDRIKLDDNRVLKVLKISLLSTTCETPEGMRVILPNYRLADMNITNYSRSRNASIYVQLEIDIDTSVETLLELKTLIYRWLKKNRLIWDTEFGFNVRRVVQQRALILGIWVSLTQITWAQPGPLFTAKTDFFVFLKETTAALYIECYGAEAKITVDFEDAKVAKKLTQKALKAQGGAGSLDSDSDHDGDDEKEDDNETAANGLGSAPPSRSGSHGAVLRMASLAGFNTPKSASSASLNAKDKKQKPTSDAAVSTAATPSSKADNDSAVPLDVNDTASVASSSTKSGSGKAKRRSTVMAVNFSDLPAPSTPPTSPPPEKKDKKKDKKSTKKDKPKTN